MVQSTLETPTLSLSSRAHCPGTALCHVHLTSRPLCSDGVHRTGHPTFTAQHPPRVALSSHHVSSPALNIHLRAPCFLSGVNLAGGSRGRTGSGLGTWRLRTRRTCAPSRSSVDSNATVMPLAGGTERGLGHEGGALVHGVSALIRDPRSSLAPPFPHPWAQREDTVRKAGSRSSADSGPAGPSTSDFQLPGLCCL